MESSKKIINRIHIIHAITYILPSIFLSIYGWTLTWIDEKALSGLLQSPVGTINSVIFVGIIPFVFRKQIQKMVIEAEEGKAELVRKKLYIGQWLYLFISILYGFSSYPLLEAAGFFEEQLTNAVILCLFCNIMLPIPLLLLILHQFDLLFKDLAIIRNKFFIGVHSKIVFANVIPTISSISFLIFGVYMLFVKNYHDGILELHILELIIRLSIIGVICILFIIVPMYFLGRKISDEIENIEAYADKIASGNLQDNLVRNSSDELGLMIEEMNTMRNNFHSILQGIQTASQNISQVGNIVQDSSTSLAKKSANQVSHTADMSNSIEHMTMNIEGNSHSAEQCDTLNAEVRNLAEESYEVVIQNVGAINEIVNKVKVINEIANQTNLLAINATIESATAGEYGAGFASVAAEIRELADKSKESAKEINTLSAVCLELVEDTQNTINTLKPKSQTTSNLSEQISKISIETLEEGLEVSKGILHLNSVAQNNSDISQDLSTQAIDLNKQVDILNELISKIKV